MVLVVRPGDIVAYRLRGSEVWVEGVACLPPHNKTSCRHPLWAYWKNRDYPTYVDMKNSEVKLIRQKKHRNLPEWF